MKCRIVGLICACVLCLYNTIALPVFAEEEPSVTGSIETIQETEEDGHSKNAKIAGFLIIFTVAMGITAFIVVRPKLKVLKEVNKKDKK